MVRITTSSSYTVISLAVCLMLLVIVFDVRKSNGQQCFTSYPEWSVAEGNILLNGQVFHVKGASWFGMEVPDTNAPHGLWSASLEKFLDILQYDIEINAVRLPFSVDLVLHNDVKKTTVDCWSNPSICNLSPLDLMEHVVDEMGKRGMLVMLDQHRLYGNDIHNLWYDDAAGYSEEKVLESWDILMDRFATKWNVFALDLKNEPHNSATWGKDIRATDWNRAAERIINHIGTNHQEYRGLFFVEGVGDNADTPTPNGYAHWWGGNMEGVHRHPISTGLPDLDRRVVYSPHTYGPNVHMQTYFSDPNFPDNMPEIWDLHFGFVEEVTGQPIVTGEWGGHYLDSLDRTWADAFATYLIDNCMSDNFYWCLNPNSGDTGGLLQNDWTTVRLDKMALLSRVQPNPSSLTKNGDQYCFEPGSFANSACEGKDTTTTTTTAASTNTETTTTTTTTAKPGTTTTSTTSTTTTPTPTSTTTSSTTSTSTSSSTSTTASTRAPSAGGDITVDESLVNQWTDGPGKPVMQVKVVLSNIGSKVLCGQQGALKIRIISPNNLKIRSFWNLVQDPSDSMLFSLHHWIKWELEPGETYSEIGLIVEGDVVPEFVVEPPNYC